MSGSLGGVDAPKVHGMENVVTVDRRRPSVAWFVCLCKQAVALVEKEMRKHKICVFFAGVNNRWKTW